MLQFRKIIVICVFLVINLIAFGQENPVPETYLEVIGISELEGSALSGARATLYEGTNEVSAVNTSSDGRFKFTLQRNKTYTIEISKDGLVSKSISFKTNLPDDVTGIWTSEFSIGLVKYCDGVDYGLLRQPVDIVEFDPGRKEFVSNREYVAKMRPGIENILISYEECMLDKYDNAVKEADRLVTGKDFDAAISAYEEALQIYPDESYPRKRIAEIEALLRKQETNEDNYNNLISQADALYEDGKFNEAQAKYKEASSVKPGEAYPKEKMQQASDAYSAQQAEIKAMQAKDDRYVQALAKANAAYSKRDYSNAVVYYEQALEIKPNEELPKSRLDEVEKIVTRLQAEAAERKQADDAYNDLVTKAETLFKEKKYEEAKQQYAAALDIKPTESYPKTRMTEIERTIQNEARDAEAARLSQLDAEYKSVIAEADKLFEAKDFDGAKAAYARALTIKPSETYPVQRNKSIDNLVTAQKAAQLKATEDSYTNALKEAGLALANSQFADANRYYRKALEIKPGDPAATRGVSEVEQLSAEYTRKVAEENRKKETFNEILKKADELYSAEDMTGARQAYTEALAVIPSDSYSKSRIASIDNLLEARESARLKSIEDGYRSAVGAANTAINQKNYTAALSYFDKALEFKPGDAFVNGRIPEVELMLADQKGDEEAARMKDEKYTALKAEGDNFLQAGDYNLAKEKYSEALTVRPDDSYSKQKIAEADNALRQEALAIKKKQEDEYTQAMTAGGSALTSKNYDEALAMFQNALLIKPGDIFATEKISEVNRAVAYVQEELRNKQNQQRQATDNSYNMAVSGADNYYRNGDYANALNEYNRALTIKPEEDYPASRIKEVEEIIAARDKEQSEINARKDAYTAAINTANGLYDKKQYEQAKAQYNIALEYSPADEFASGRITVIEQMIAGIEKQKQADDQRVQQVNGYISEADSEFDGGNYTAARHSYQKAHALDPANTYVKQRISRIDEIERILASAGKSKPSSSASAPQSVSSLAELQFRNENEKLTYLNSLKDKYPEGITVEIYKEDYKDTYRYIIIRKSEVQEFRRISYTKFAREEYSMNGKPITQMYFLSQVKKREGELYKEIVMQ